MKNKIIIDLVFFLFGVLTTVVPTCRKKICFTSFPNMSDNCYALYRHFSRKDGADRNRYVWLVTDDTQKIRDFIDSDPELSRLSKATKVIKKKSFSGVTLGLFHFLTARYTFHTHGIFWLFRSAKGNRIIVNLWHGMALKKLGLLESPDIAPAAGDFSIATSPLFQKVMAAIFGMPPEKVLITGLPRVDLFGRRPPNLSRFVDDSRGYRRVVVWMPTYRKSTIGRQRTDSTYQILTEGMLRDLNERCRKDNVLCLVKLHPMEQFNNSLHHEFSHVRIVKNSDLADAAVNIYEILGVTDRLVTDYSSIFIDFALLKRPMGFYVPDETDYSRGFIPEVVDGIGYPGRILRTKEDLYDFVVADDEAPGPTGDVLLKMNSYPQHQSVCENLEQALGLHKLFE